MPRAATLFASSVSAKLRFVTNSTADTVSRALFSISNRRVGSAEAPVQAIASPRLINPAISMLSAIPDTGL